MDVQIDYALWELDNTESYAKKHFKKAKTVTGATEVFCKKYERPGSPHMSKRHDAAVVIMKEIQKIKNG